MKLYLVRHGESEANKHNLHSTPKTKLTKTGILQAQILAKRLKNIDIDFIYTSSLTRTIETAHEISKIVGIKVEVWDDLVEVKTPSVSWGKPRRDTDALKIEKTLDENYVTGARHSDEESFGEIKERAERILNHLLKKHESQNVLVISHASFIKMVLLTAVLGKKLNAETFIEFRNHSRTNNSGVSVLEYSKEHGWVLDSWNDRSHL